MSIKHKIKIKQQNFEENKDEAFPRRCCPLRRTGRKRI